MAEDSTVSELNKLQKQLAGVRQHLESDWFLNLAYYYGNQWVFWNRGRIDKPRLEPWRLMLVDNRILPVAFSRVARKVKNRPAFQVTPNSYDEADLMASEVGGKVLDDDWINLHLQKKLFRVLLWAEVVSAGFWKISWDQTKGDSENYMFGPDNEPFLNQDQRPVRAADAGELINAEGYSSKSIAQGNVQVDVLSPFNVYPDPIVEDEGISECEIIIEEHVRSIEYIKKHYNEDVKPDTNIAPGLAESRSFPTLSTGGSSGDYQGAVLYELYAKPGSKYGTEGKRSVWTKEKQLLEETLEKSPYSGCPYVMFSGIDVPGRFWPTCITSQLRGPQTELNKIKSQIRENALRIGNPSLLKSRHANVHYSGVPGEEIYYDPNAPDSVPSYLQPPEMPMYVQSEVERIEHSITEISGIHEVSKATVPSGVTAASAINLLQEADDTRLGPEIQDMEQALGYAGTKILKLRAKFQDDERIIQSAGEDGEWDIVEFRNSTLKENTNVEVQAGSAMPRSKAAKQAAMQEMLGLVLQYGLDIQPRDLRKYLRDYGVGGLEHMFASLTVDELQIRREHNYMRNGEPIDINDWDDDDLHIEAHNEFRKSRTFERIDEGAKKAINLHVQSHQERRMKAMEAQLIPAEEAMAMNGGQTQSQPQPTE